MVTDICFMFALNREPELDDDKGLNISTNWITNINWRKKRSMLFSIPRPKAHDPQHYTLLNLFHFLLALAFLLLFCYFYTTIMTHVCYIDGIKSEPGYRRMFRVQSRKTCTIRLDGFLFLSLCYTSCLSWLVVSSLV